MRYVLFEVVEPHIVLVTLNRPQRLNAFGNQLSRELEEAMCIYEDDPNLRAAILTGAGRAFCAGADLKEWSDKGTPPYREFPRRMLINEWGSPNLSKPLIGAVNGYCLGAGLNMVLARCDLRVAGESATFGLPEVARGIPTLASPFVYLGLPTCFIAEMAFTGKNVDAWRAYHFGLVNVVVPDDKVVETALEYARAIAQHSPEAVRTTKRHLVQVMAPSEGRFAKENYLEQQFFGSINALAGIHGYVAEHESDGEI